MKMSIFTVELERLEKNKIELLRNWRNSEFVQSQMEYRQSITPEMQLKWFESINNEFNFYFLIKHKHEYWGMIHLSNINYENRTANSGLFLTNYQQIDNIVSVFASSLLLKFAFEDLNLEKIFAKVKNDNHRALSYNQQWGFMLTEKRERFSQYELTVKTYYEKSRKIIDQIYRLYG